MHDLPGDAAPVSASEAPADAQPAVQPDVPPEPRQRWRLTVARSADAPTQTQRELAEAWEAAVVSGAGLPVARGIDSKARPRISFGAPLPVGMAANGELIDVVLTERWPVWRVREALEPVVPEGWRVCELSDVWLAGPPLAGRVVAADYRVTVSARNAVAAVGRDAATVDGPSLARACASVLATERIERVRRKGESMALYDLRPLLVDVRVADAGPPPILSVRTRFHPELGTGRPEEVVGALGDVIGVALEPVDIVRERLILVDDLAGEGP